MVDGFTNLVADPNFPPLDVEALADMMRYARVRNDVRMSRAYFWTQQIDPCRVCGEKIEYHEQPTERYEMCRHLLDELKRQFPAPASYVPPPFPDLMAMPIYLKGEA